MQTQEGGEELLHVKIRRGGHEEMPLIQGKRNPSKMIGVARGHQRVDTLKPYSQKTSQSNHTSTIAFSNSLGPMDILILIIPIHQSINMECLFTCPCLV